MTCPVCGHWAGEFNKVDAAGHHRGCPDYVAPPGTFDGTYPYLGGAERIAHQDDRNAITRGSADDPAAGGT